ncbi:hypothetical protein ABT093_38320, partial [Kitasatospora sp. NPDC002551]
MGGVLRAEPVWAESFTGLRLRQAEGLARVVRERGGIAALRPLLRHVVQQVRRAQLRQPVRDPLHPHR